MVKIKFGNHGKSALGIVYKNFALGAESENYKSYDKKEYTQSQSVPEVSWGVGVEIGLIVSFHTEFSVSFSGIYNDLISHGKQLGWWQ